MNDLLLKLLGHMRWADALVADALQGTPTPDREAERLFAHIASVEHLWYSRILERQPDYAVWPSLAPSESRGLASETASLFEQLVTEAGVTALARVVSYRNSAGRDYHNSIADIITHVAMHGSHHRGQIVRQLRASGIEPPYVDYVQFARRDQ
jgi:uncharacterized damage-inducible protein DinB